MLTFHQIFPFIKKADENRDLKKFEFWMGELTKMGVKVTSRELNELITFAEIQSQRKMHTSTNGV